jgi:hypothetical protein
LERLQIFDAPQEYRLLGGVLLNLFEVSEQIRDIAAFEDDNVDIFPKAVDSLAVGSAPQVRSGISYLNVEAKNRAIERGTLELGFCRIIAGCGCLLMKIMGLAEWNGVCDGRCCVPGTWG